MTETPTDRMVRKKTEDELRKGSKRKENLYRSLLSHVVGVIYIVAELGLGYKPDLRDRK